MTFINSLKVELAKLPDDLQSTVTASLQQWEQQLAELALEFQATPEIIASIVKVWCSSSFVTESCLRNPELLIDLVESGDLLTVYEESSYTRKLGAVSIETDVELMQKLRWFRRREMTRIAWRDLAGWAPLSETLVEVSWLADTCIQFALAFLYKQACEKRGTPVLADGSSQQIVILGMGKLGAYELNYSSDIDLIFAYPENGQLSDRKETSYS